MTRIFFSPNEQALLAQGHIKDAVQALLDRHEKRAKLRVVKAVGHTVDAYTFSIDFMVNRESSAQRHAATSGHLRITVWNEDYEIIGTDFIGAHFQPLEWPVTVRRSFDAVPAFLWHTWLADFRTRSSLGSMLSPLLPTQSEWRSYVRRALRLGKVLGE